MGKKHKILPRVIIVLVFVTALISYCEIRLRNAPNSYTIKRDNFEKQMGSDEALILGSSEALYGIDPKYFSVKAYNLAEVSQSLYYDKELIMKYIERMPSLKIVLISVSYFSLWFELYNAVENWRDDYYYISWGIKSNNPAQSWLKQFSCIDLYGTSFSQNAFRKNFRVLDKYPHENGWYNPADNDLTHGSSSFIQVPLTDSAAGIMVEIHYSQMKDEFLQRNISYLDTLLAALVKHKIAAEIITPPVYKYYTAHTVLVKNKINQEVIQKLCDKYKCSYYDFLNDARFSYEDFLDDNHLNSKGSAKFSGILNDEIISKK
jgi:hypothetical protein